MMKATENEVLNLFKKVHGELSASCEAEVSVDDNGNTTGVDCVKDDQVVWSCSLTELLLDLYVMDQRKGNV